MRICSDRSAVADLMRSPRFILGLAGCWDVSAVAEAMLPQSRKQWCARRRMNHVVRACSLLVRVLDLDLRMWTVKNTCA